MNCHKVENLISAYVDGELPGLEMLALRQHLSICSRCSQEYESLLNVKRVVGRLLPRAPSADLAERICRRLEQVQLSNYQYFLAALRRHISFSPARLRVAAIGVAVLAALVLIRPGEITVRPGYAISPVSPMQVGMFAEAKPVHVVSPPTLRVLITSDMPIALGMAYRPWSPGSGAGATGFTLAEPSGSPSAQVQPVNMYK